jgi:hypothetical protein
MERGNRREAIFVDASKPQTPVCSLRQESKSESASDQFLLCAIFTVSKETLISSSGSWPPGLLPPGLIVDMYPLRGEKKRGQRKKVRVHKSRVDVCRYFTIPH